MLGNAFSDPLYLVTLITLFIVSITLHEFGHAKVAELLGDSTARDAGRVTLNPIAHLDLFGSLMLLFAGFGWAKPVPVDPNHFKHPRVGNVLVSVAGPAMNLLLALLALAAFKYAPDLSPGAAMWLKVAFQLNMVLLVFNLLPIPPLDGGHVLEALMPRRWLPAYQHAMPYGVVLLLVMVFMPGPWSPLSWLFASVQGFMIQLI